MGSEHMRDDISACHSDLATHCLINSQLLTGLACYQLCGKSVRTVVCVKERERETETEGGGGGGEGGGERKRDS